MIKWRKKWREGLEKSRGLRLLRRVLLLGVGAATAAVMLKFTQKESS